MSVFPQNPNLDMDCEEFETAIASALKATSSELDEAREEVAVFESGAFWVVVRCRACGFETELCYAYPEEIDLDDDILINRTYPSHPAHEKRLGSVDISLLRVIPGK